MATCSRSAVGRGLRSSSTRTGHSSRVITPAVCVVTTWPPRITCSASARRPRALRLSAGNRSPPNGVDVQAAGAHICRTPQSAKTRRASSSGSQALSLIKLKKKLLRKRQEQEVEARKRPPSGLSKQSDPRGGARRLPALKQPPCQVRSCIEDQQLRVLGVVGARAAYIRRAEPWLACHGPRPSLKRFQSQFQPHKTALLPLIRRAPRRPADRPNAPRQKASSVDADRERFPLAFHNGVLSTASLTHP